MTGTAHMARTVVVLAADRDVAPTLARLLDRADVAMRAVTTTEEAVAMLEAHPVEVLVTELEPSGGDVLGLLAVVNERCPAVPVVVITSEATMAGAVEALRAGALDFLLRPFVAEQVAYVLGKASSHAERRRDDPELGSTAMLGESQVMAEVWSVLRRAAPGDATVLVRGESGTGKELVARAIHEQSPRAARPFVKIDCAALPDALLESELFGYEKGAFTGAGARKPGRVELADGGTLFLDEIGELGTAVQAKLLRLLQDREIERLGGTRTIRVDVRVVAATHRDLETMIDREQFRQDLFYRLNVVPLWLPPLRARRGDIGLLARHFAGRFGSAHGKPAIALDEHALKLLRSQRWPGNVRQLQNLIERLVVLAEEPTIGAEAVRDEIAQRVRFVTQPTTTSSSSGEHAPAEPHRPPSLVGPLADELRDAERRALMRALKHAGGNRTLAARLLGVSRSTFYEKLAEHGIS